MTADELAFTEQIEDAIMAVRDAYPRQHDDAPSAEVVAVVLPILRAAQANALRQAAKDYWGIEGDPDYPSTSRNVRHVLNRRADNIERENPHG